MPRRECLVCRRLTSYGSRCEGCAGDQLRAREAWRHRHRVSAARRGYDRAWQRLVRLAKDAQRIERGHAWCVDCGLTDEQAHASSNPLTGDHLRWPALTVADVEVTCRQCNSRRGALRTSAH